MPDRDVRRNQANRGSFPLLPRLSGDTPARYDLRLSVNLMQGASQLTDAGKHVKASLFYALTMTTEEIKAFYTDREKRLQTEVSQIEQFLALKAAVLPKRRLSILKDKSNDLSMKLTNAKSQLSWSTKPLLSPPRFVGEKPKTTR